jgi:ribosomal protein S18 acetylase RimI-like enzyme
VGFAVLYDGDEDGQYETLSHIWTAAAARRRGVARALIAHARQHFPLKHIAGPATDGGTALLKAVWPEAISERA